MYPQVLAAEASTAATLVSFSWLTKAFSLG